MALIVAYFALSAARWSGAVPESWSLMPVIDTAWLNALVVVAVIAWMKARGIPLASVGMQGVGGASALGRLVAITMVVDTLAVGVATPVLEAVFGQAPPVDRFASVPGNLPLLLALVPAMWVIAAFGEEFFFRGFLLTTLAELLGASRVAWGAAVVIQAIAFGLVHAYQGPAQAVAVGIGGAVYGCAFVLGGRSLWPVILAHGINDTLGLILLYSGSIQG
jgi:membrane protease YdiL (CAAX protease family)